MSIELNPVFHWSPRERLKSICRKGLVLNAPTARGPFTEDEGWTAPYICFGTTPFTAWRYCLPKPDRIYDLWEVYLNANDTVSFPENNRGNRIVEVRCHNRIMKRRLNWVCCVDSCWTDLKTFQDISRTVPHVIPKRS